VIDNLKAAVTKADWYDPELNPKIVEFAQHYGFVVLPTRPYTPRHKGKAESGVKYVKSNALKGRVFTGLAEHNLFLIHRERQVANTRVRLQNLFSKFNPN
jgi:transposase